MKEKVKKKKSKEKKVQRLLNHLKLVEEQGLPPNRLMQQQHQLQTPMLNSSETYKRRNLLYEFGKLGGSEEGTGKVGSQAVPSGTAAVGGGGEEAVPVQQTYSCSYSPSLYDGNQPYGGSGYTGGSDARPHSHLMTEWNYPQNFHQGSTGVSSGYMKQTSLCSSPLTLLEWNFAAVLHYSCHALDG
jgi:hypothetical protein